MGIYLMTSLYSHLVTEGASYSLVKSSQNAESHCRVSATWSARQVLHIGQTVKLSHSRGIYANREVHATMKRRDQTGTEGFRQPDGG